MCVCVCVCVYMCVILVSHSACNVIVTLNDSVCTYIPRYLAWLK